MRLSVSQAARADIDEIWVYLATQSSLESADRFRTSLGRIFLLLLQNPFAGRSRDELKGGLRSLRSGKYIVFYRVEMESVRILRVLHGMRDLSATLR